MLAEKDPSRSVTATPFAGKLKLPPDFVDNNKMGHFQSKHPYIQTVIYKVTLLLPANGYFPSLIYDCKQLGAGDRWGWHRPLALLE